MPDDTPNENSAPTEAAKEKPDSTHESLKDLKNLITEKNLQTAVTRLVDIAAQNENVIPQKTIDEIIKLLDPKEEQDLKNFLEGHTEEFRLKNVLNALGKEVTGKALDQKKNAPADKVIGMINGITGKIKLDGKLGSLVSLLGFGGKEGSESGFLQNFLVDTFAKFTEQFAFTFGKNKTMLEVAKQLRMKRLGITGTNQDSYAKAYDQRVKEAGNKYENLKLPEDLTEAVAINTAPVKKEIPGTFNKETNTVTLAKSEKPEPTKKEGTDKAETKTEKAA